MTPPPPETPRRPRRGGRRREPRIVNLATHPRSAVSLTVAAEYLQLHEQTVRARIEDGRLAAIRDGRAYRITLTALATYEASRDGMSGTRAI